MRGGAWPVLAWACLIGLLFAGDWIWTGETVEVAVYGFAVLMVLTTGVALVLHSREAIRRGPPPHDEGRRLHSVPDFSTGAVGAALAVAFVVFGLAFGHFLIYFGCGLFVLALGRLTIELRAQRHSERRLAGAPGERDAPPAAGSPTPPEAGRR